MCALDVQDHGQMEPLYAASLAEDIQHWRARLGSSGRPTFVAEDIKNLLKANHRNYDSSENCVTNTVYHAVLIRNNKW